VENLLNKRTKSFNKAAAKAVIPFDGAAKAVMPFDGMVGGRIHAAPGATAAILPD
jgi:hypothetical protein